MFRRIALLWLWATTLYAAAPSYITFPSDIDWVTRWSDHFQIVYRRGQDRFAERALHAAERAHRLLTPIFPEGPDVTRILLADFHDDTNGYALEFPYPHIVLFAAPPDAGSQLSALDDWFPSLVLHEYTHIKHIWPAHGLWRLTRSIFGNIIIPNGLLPTHFHEGMATFMETNFTDGGRGRGSHFSMIKRMAVNAGVWGTSFVPLDRLEGTPSLWPQGVSPYFWGWTLTNDLWSRKGAKGIHDLTLSYSDNWPYLFNGPLREVYGVENYDELWKQIFKKTGDETRREIAEIKRTPLAPLKYLTQSGFNKWDLALSPNASKLVFRRNDPENGSSLDFIDANTGKLIEQKKLWLGVTEGMCWGQIAGREWLVFNQQTGENNYGLYFLGGYDLKNNRSMFFTSGDRRLPHVLRMDCSPDLSRFLVYQETDGKGYIKELEWNSSGEDPKFEVKVTRDWPVPEGDWVTSFLAASPATGGVTWVAIRHRLKTGLFRWDLGHAPQKVMDVDTHVFNLRAGRTPHEILAIANFDNRQEVWAIDPFAGTSSKRVGLLGGTTSFVANGSNVWLSSYEHGGFDIAKTTERYAQAKPALRAPVLRKIAATSAADVPAKDRFSEVEGYSPLATLLPRNWIPTFLFVPGGAEFGVWIPGFDLTQKHLYDLVGGYDTRGLAFASLAYTYRFGSSYYTDWNAYLFPNYIISTAALLKQWGGSVGLGGRIGHFPLDIHVSTLFKRTEGNPLFAAANQSVGAGIDLAFEFGIKRRPLDVTETAGTRISLSHAQFFQAAGSDDNYFASSAGVDQYVTAPWANTHAFYLGVRGGYTEGSTLFNSYFQGGGELIFSQARGFFLNRGFQPGTFLARRIVNLNVEYRFPMFRVDHGVGLWPLFLKDVSAALVSDVTTFDAGLKYSGGFNTIGLFKYYFTSAGIELKSNWTLSYYLPALVRVGAYHGFGPFGEGIYGVLGVEAAL